ncbi:hypothetical protein LINPERHAP2_LOCUS25565 [Linum perenne]
MLRKYRPTIIFISETRNQRDVLEKKRRAAKFPNFWYQDPIGSRRGLALWWVGNFQINVLSCNEFYVDVQVNENPSFFLSCVHAPNSPSERASLWNHLGTLRDRPEDPWIILGDFNAITSNEDKEGGRVVDYVAVEPFNDFIFNNGLMDMGFRGQNFTWTNYKEGDENIKERIDRAMCNVEWRRRFERAIVFHEPMNGSDHTPLRIDLDGQRITKTTPLMFDKR